MLAPNSRKTINISDPRSKHNGKTQPYTLGKTDTNRSAEDPSAEDCLVDSDLDGKILSWGRGAEQLFGYSPEEMLGRHVDKLFLPGHKKEKASARRPHRTERFQTVRLRKDGTQIDVSVVLVPVKDAGGKLSGISAAYRPIVTGGTESPVPAKGTTKPTLIGDRPKVMLATAGAGGTIAAVRLLNKNGFDVGVISSERLATAAWSKAATVTHNAPPESEGDKFLEWLMKTGAASPGQVLLPTSDQTSWLYTLHSRTLSQHFRMYQPSVETMQNILDKNLFAEAVLRAGLSVLPSWEPRNMDEVKALAPTLPYPILIKPRTHVHRLRNDKGLVVRNKAEMIEKYGPYVDQESVRAAENPLLPDAQLPILQQFVDVSKEGVYSVSGFIDRSGELFVTRRSVKVFQRSQPVGVGICFEGRPAMPQLSNGVRRLCRELGYFGLFEVEFIRFGDQWAAIDFNPRLFNQVGLDILRGMPLPLLACLDALDKKAALREAVAQAQAVDEDEEAVFCDRFTFRSILIAKTLTGRITSAERAYWRNWMKKHSGHAADFAVDTDDEMPGLIHALSEIFLGLKAFPKFLRLTPKTNRDVQPSLSKVRS